MFHKSLDKSLMTAAFLAAFLATGLTGCLPFEVACTDIAVSSASIDIQNEQGEAIVGATVRFSTAEVAEQECQEFSGPGNYVCGFEVAGDLLITIEAEGYEPTDLTVTVEQDECHVITEQRAVTLTAAPQPA